MTTNDPYTQPQPQQQPFYQDAPPAAPAYFDAAGMPVVFAMAPAANPEKNGFGIAALITGIIGILFCIMPITGFIGFALGVIAFIFGLAGWGRVRKNKATNKKTAIAGVATGLLAIIFGIIGIVIFFSALNELGDDLDDIGNDDCYNSSYEYTC